MRVYDGLNLQLACGKKCTYIYVGFGFHVKSKISQGRGNNVGIKN
jgi:hypothetical protein